MNLFLAYAALCSVSERNRAMPPGNLLLILIPFFGFIWYFIIVSRVATSLEDEFRERGLRQENDFGRMYGFLAIIPCCGIIFMILCNLQLAGAVAELARSNRSSSRRSRDDDDDDR